MCVSVYTCITLKLKIHSALVGSVPHHRGKEAGWRQPAAGSESLLWERC